MGGTSDTDRLRDRASPAWLRGLLSGRRAVLLRRALAVLLLVAAGTLAVYPTSADGGDEGLPTVVSARDLPSGGTLRPADLRVATVPADLRPHGALSVPEAAAGRVLTGAARAGEPITDARLMDPASTAPGTSTVPVRLADAGVAELLHSGRRVDVVTVGPGEEGRKVLPGPATVLTVAAAGDQPRDGPARREAEPLVLLSVPVEDATRLAAVSLAHPVAITLR
ncbi:SAF domain-containing protein [Amycolatopsis cihanbeyliensis]|uniref:Flp pilus assembly protein CpaB n=1 Tax=Amycolatopsis cihanbeyliensis TaxID=1128664 RepID=A0A542DI05_AMYCI|nr:SAF domain-containing protein [Amycolatopsis cihanbeyliensis]TQJ02728.1 Flp pilus assembly protein CpaB [Amycolatopsis cihanbeyliensis]